MSRYSRFKERQENASPYAGHAVCRKCVHCSNVRAAAFCEGFGRSRKLPSGTLFSDKEGYCTQYYPRDEERKENKEREPLTF